MARNGALPHFLPLLLHICHDENQPVVPRHFYPRAPSAFSQCTPTPWPSNPRFRLLLKPTISLPTYPPFHRNRLAPAFARPDLWSLNTNFTHCPPPSPRVVISTATRDGPVSKLALKPIHEPTPTHRVSPRGMLDKPPRTGDSRASSELVVRYSWGRTVANSSNPFVLAHFNVSILTRAPLILG
jgi:hypothetical protein